MKPMDILNVMYAPSTISKIIHCFSSGACSVVDSGVKYEAVYFVLPFVFDDRIRKKLYKSKSTTTFSSLFKNSSEKQSLISKNDEIENYRDVTNDGIIYISMFAQIELGEFFKVTNSKNMDDARKSPLKEYYVAAYRLGQVIAKEDYLTLYRRIGVTSI